MTQPQVQGDPKASAGKPEQEPPLDPIFEEKIEAAKPIAFHLLKGIKQIGMYRHAENKYGEYLTPTLQAFNNYLEKFGPLALKVEQQNFQLYGKDLFDEPTTLAYRFWGDGIRNLIFRPGITIQEIITFTLLALTENDRAGEDLLAQLWKAGFEHIEYVVVEGFKLDDSTSEEQVQVEVDHVVSFLYSRLKAQSEDFLRFARVSTDDLDVKMEGVDQIRGAVVSGETADDAIKAKVQREIAEEESDRLFPKLISAVFQVVETGIDDAMQLDEMFGQLLDALLMQEDFGAINQMVFKLKAMEQRPNANASIGRLREAIIIRISEEQRMMRVGDLLRGTRPKNVNDLIRYFQLLEIDAVPMLLTVLETIDLPENRSMLYDLLAPFCTKNPDPFIVRLQSDRPQTVRDMVAVLERAKVPDRLKLFAGALTNKNLAVKLEVMNIIAQGKTGEARRVISDMLNDPNQQVRSAAARLLPEFDRDQAHHDLMKVIESPDFEKKDPLERTALYAALGSTGIAPAMKYLSDLLHQKGTFLHRKKALDDKLLAIHGLESACSVQSYKVLMLVTEDKSQPVEVLTAARKAMHHVKKTLFGEGEAPSA